MNLPAPDPPKGQPDRIRGVVATREGRFRDRLLASPPPGFELVPLALPPSRPDRAIELLCVGGMPLPMVAILEALPGLRWIHASSAGVERFLSPNLVERDEIVVTNTSGTHEAPMAEFVIGAMFAAAKSFPAHLRRQQEHRWPTGKEHAAQRLLRGSTVLIVGPGRVGREVAKLARGLGMRILAVRRTDAALPEADEVGTPADLPRLAAAADYVVVTAALTPETRGLVSREVIAALKPEAWLVNAGRGAVVDEAALLEAIETGRIGGAVLDTLWQEPLPEDSPWWSMPNVIVTGHTSSGSADTADGALAFFAENARRYRAGEPLLNVVDKRAGY